VEFIVRDASFAPLVFDSPEGDIDGVLCPATRFASTVRTNVAGFRKLVSIAV
jgi:hypothetical protein